MTTRSTDPSQQMQQVEEKPDANAELRAYADRVKAENAALRQQVLQGHLSQIGLNVDQGLGKAIAKEYSGEITSDAVAEYAKSEYGYEPAAATDESKAQQLDQAQQRVEQVQAESSPVTPTGLVDKIAEHDQTLAKPEASRADAQAAIADKLKYYLQEVRSR